MQRKITAETTLDNLKKEARRWLKALRANDAAARERLQRMYPKLSGSPVLRDVQHALALEYGLENWKDLKLALQRSAAAKYQQAAEDFVHAYEGDAPALERLNQHYERSFGPEDLRAEIWRRVYAFRQRSSRVSKNYLELAEAQLLIAQDAGFGSWTALMEAVVTGAPPAVMAYGIDTKENRAAPRRRMTAAEWDELIGVLRERRIPALDASGLMTDAVLARVADLDHITALSLGGSRELTDDGLLHLARMPQLEYLNLSEYPGGKLTDRGLEVLRHLPNLRTFEMTWQAGISDAGIANLRFCELLERVDLMGSPTGDGAIEALQGKSRLRNFSSGRLVTDAGLALLQNFPLLKKWPGGDAGGARLLIDGPFTNGGLAGLAGLEGVFDLDLFWHVSGITVGWLRPPGSPAESRVARLRRRTERRCRDARISPRCRACANCARRNPLPRTMALSP